MNVLQDVRLAEKEWARRFSSRREAPQLSTGRWQFEINRVLTRCACALQLLGYTAARNVEAGLNLLMPANVRQARHRSRSASCVYRG